MLECIWRVHAEDIADPTVPLTRVAHRAHARLGAASWLHPTGDAGATAWTCNGSRAIPPCDHKLLESTTGKPIPRPRAWAISMSKHRSSRRDTHSGNPSRPFPVTYSHRSVCPCTVSHLLATTLS
eukprot:345004-Prymnesium_polylepis.1